MDLHIAGGGISSKLSIHSEYLGDRVERDSDCFDVGPLVSDLGRFWSIRQAYLHSLAPRCPPSDSAVWFGDLSEQLRGVDRVCLWLTTCLRDQIFGCLYTTRLAAIGFPVARIDVALAGSNKNAVCLAGECLKERSYGAEPLVRRPLEAAEWHALQHCWCALTSSTPDALLTFLADTTHQGLPERESLRALVGHFPSRTTGLDVWQERLLDKLARQVERRGQPLKSAYVIGNCLSDHNDEVDVPGDLYLFASLLGLDQLACAAPLIESSGERIAIRFVSLGLTELGHDVLAGRESFLDHNPIDRWVAGVHLDSSRDQVWVRDGDELVRWPC